MSYEKNEANKNINTDFKGISPPKNFITPFLLLSLRDFNLHGYRLIQRLNEFGFSSIDQGNIYRILRQLEKDDFIKSEWDTSSGGPAKRIYCLTDSGKKYLELVANSMEQYQSMLNNFFNMYKDFFLPNLHSKDLDE